MERWREARYARALWTILVSYSKYIEKPLSVSKPLGTFATNCQKNAECVRGD
jgi:hypothetical protein